MDKYEYRVKTEQMLSQMEKKNYRKAMDIADTIDWHKVKNASMLVTVSEIYENNGEFQKSRDTLMNAFERAPSSRKIVYKLAILALKLHEVSEASECYEEYVRIAPKDPNQYILRYRILKAQGSDISEQIAALEEFKKAEYIEKWAYELAKLYEKAGMTAKCLEECDDLILWFSEGKYVYQAMELKMKYKPLTPLQQEKYDEYKGVKKTVIRRPQPLEQRVLPKAKEVSPDTLSIPQEKIKEAEAKLEAEKEAEKTAVDNVTRKIPVEDLDKALEELGPKTEDPVVEKTRKLSALNIPGVFPESKLNKAFVKELTGVLPEEEEENETPVDVEEVPEEVEVPEIQEAPIVPEDEPEEEIVPEEPAEDEVPDAPKKSIKTVVQGATLKEALANGVAIATGITTGAEKRRMEEREAEIRVAGQVKIEDILQEWEAKQKKNAEAIAIQKAQDEARIQKEREALRMRREAEEREAHRREEEEIARRKHEEAVRLEAERAAEEQARLEEEKAAKQAEEHARFEEERKKNLLSDDIRQLVEELEERVANQGDDHEDDYDDDEDAYTIEEELDLEEINLDDEPDVRDADEDEDDTEVVDEDEEPEAEEFEEADFEEVDEEPEEEEFEEADFEEVEDEEPEEEEFEEADFEEADEDEEPEEEEFEEADFEEADEDEEPEAEEFEEADFEEVDEDEDDFSEEEFDDEEADFEEDEDDFDEEEFEDEDDFTEEEFDDEDALEEDDFSEEDFEEEEDDFAEEEFDEEEEDDFAEEEFDEEEEDDFSEEDFEEEEDDFTEEEFEEDEDDFTEEEFEEDEDDFEEDFDEDDFDEDDFDDDDFGEDAFIEDDFSEDDYEDDDFDEDDFEEEDFDEDEDDFDEDEFDLSGELPEVPEIDYDDLDEDFETHEPSEEEIQKRIKKSKGKGVPFDTGFVVTGRYDLSATSEIGLKAGLTEEQKKLFSYFVPVRGMSEQIVAVLDNDRRSRREGTSKTGNLLIIGRKGSGKTVLAVDIVKAIQKQRNLKQGKVAIVTGESLNKKELTNIIQKLRGGAIIIEKAGKLNSRTVKELDALMEKQTGEMLFVLEDQRKPLERMMTANPNFKKKFNSKLELPVFINDELVTFGQTYAKENGYKLDEMGILALYSKIDIMQREDHAVTVAEVKEMMDEAIQHSQRANVKHLARRVFGKSTDSSDRIILKEEDFKI